MEGALGLGERLVRADDVGAGELAGGDARAQDAEAVEGRLLVDPCLVAVVGEAVVGQLEFEVLAHLALVDDGADGGPDRGGAAQRALLDALLDRGELSWTIARPVARAIAPVRDDGISVIVEV